MRAAADVYIDPKPALRHLADSYWEQRSRFLLPHRLRLNTARLAAVVLPEPAVGSLWTPCRPKDGEHATAEALCLYLNSSVGLLALLGGRGNRVPSYPWFSLEAQRSIPVPNFAEIDAGARDFLAARFNWLQDMALLPLPRMDEDPVRKQIDDAVTEALGLDAEWVGANPPRALERAVGHQPPLRDVGAVPSLVQPEPSRAAVRARTARRIGAMVPRSAGRLSRSGQDGGRDCGQATHSRRD